MRSSPGPKGFLCSESNAFTVALAVPENNPGWKSIEYQGRPSIPQSCWPLLKLTGQAGIHETM